MNRAYAAILNRRGKNITQEIRKEEADTESRTQILRRNPVVGGNPARDKRHREMVSFCGKETGGQDDDRGAVFGEKVTKMISSTAKSSEYRRKKERAAGWDVGVRARNHPKLPTDE